MSGDYIRLRIPIDEGLNDRLQAFWRDIFGDAPDIEPGGAPGQRRQLQHE